MTDSLCKHMNIQCLETIKSKFIVSILKSNQPFHLYKKNCYHFFDAYKNVKYETNEIRFSNHNDSIILLFVFIKDNEKWTLVDITSDSIVGREQDIYY